MYLIKANCSRKDLRKENEALTLQNRSLQMKLESTENQSKFEILLLKRKSEELSAKIRLYSDYHELEQRNKHLKEEVTKYQLKILNKNEIINKIISENNLLYQNLVYKRISEINSSLSGQNKRIMPGCNEDKENIPNINKSKKGKEALNSIHIRNNLHKFRAAVANFKMKHTTAVAAEHPGEIAKTHLNKDVGLSNGGTNKLPSLQGLLYHSFNTEVEECKTGEDY